MKLQVLITVYNEGKTLEKVVTGVVRELDKTRFMYDIVILNDGSTDWTQARENRLRAMRGVQVISFDHNRGKGAVLNEVLPRLNGEITVVIDADDEYAPKDIKPVLDPLIRDEADWVLGSRYGFGRKRPRQYLSTYLSNLFFNRLFNFLSGLKLQDLLTGLFAFRSQTVKGITLKQKRFAFTPELLWKAYRRKNPRWAEVPISYRFRGYGAGKKIEWWEFFTVTWAIFLYGFRGR